jgi:signal peptidase I
VKIGDRILKPGDLIKFRDYIYETDHYGLYIGPIYKTHPEDDPSFIPWSDIYVWSSKGEEEWISWQCEVVSDDRGLSTS